MWVRRLSRSHECDPEGLQGSQCLSRRWVSSIALHDIATNSDRRKEAGSVHLKDLDRWEIRVLENVVQLEVDLEV